ncbi:MAG: hypothetical protein JXL20_05360 [Deltaproteobacteria bacterium]|nr:hypothetical protein [Deltaproteobacteria bacterium]
MNIIRCNRCILPATYPDLRLNGEGVCHLCLMPPETRPAPEELKKRLDEIIAVHRGKGKYEALVGLSGGKDSSYVAYYLRREYGLKMLGINFDNGYSSDYAVRNLTALVDAYGIDLVVLRPAQTFLKKLFAHFLRTHGEFCSVCNNMGYLLMASYSLSQQRALGYTPLGVGGWSKKYEFQPGISVTSMQYFFKNLTPELFAELIAQPFIEEKAVRAYMNVRDPRQVKINSNEHTALGDSVISLIQLPDYVPWDLFRMPGILRAEFGWEQPSGRHDSHFDCTLFPIKEYLKFKKYGLTQETIKNSILIREGLLTREKALERIKMEQTTEPESLHPFLRELGVDPQEVNEEGEWSR